MNKRRWKPNESGAMLPYTIIFTLVMMVAILPLLTYLSVSLRTAGRYGQQTEAYFARDAGVEYAIASLKNDRALLSGLSSAVLTPVALPIPPVPVNSLAAESVTAILLAPGQWDTQ